MKNSFFIVIHKQKAPASVTNTGNVPSNQNFTLLETDSLIDPTLSKNSSVENESTSATHAWEVTYPGQNERDNEDQIFEEAMAIANEKKGNKFFSAGMQIEI